ncbi:MAG: serine hydrolase [Bacteroidota bacterium]
MSSIKKTIVQIAIVSAICCTATFFITQQIYKAKSATLIKLAKEQQLVQPSECGYQVQRLSGYQYIKPLQFVEPDCESPKYETLKNQLSKAIETNKNNGNLMAASVYLRDFDKGAWIYVNQSEKFHPGSLMKIAVLMTILKIDELKPGLLEKRLTYQKNGKICLFRCTIQSKLKLEKLIRFGNY